MHFDAIVVGGGIIGASSAFEIAKQNLKVALFDNQQFGHGASGNSAAMLEFQLDSYRGEPFFSLAKTSADLFPALYEEVKQLTGIDFQYERCGILQLALNQQEAKSLKDETVRQKKLGLAATWLNPEQLIEKIPSLSVECFGGIVYENDGQVNGEKYLSAMIAAAIKKGVHVQDDLADVSLLIDEGRVTGVKTAKGDHTAEKIVIAAGAWTDQLLKTLDIKTGIEPVRGQLVVYTAARKDFPLPVYTKSGGYLTPKSDGYALAGTTVEHAGFDSSTTKEGEATIRELAKMLFSDLSKMEVRGVTAGLRPKSPDDLPIIGPLPGHKNVIVAAGHYRNGILLAPVTSKMVAALVTNKQPALPVAPFTPERVLSKT